MEVCRTSTEQVEQKVEQVPPVQSTGLVEIKSEKFTEKLRKELMKKKLDATQVLELLKKGLSLWDVTEAVYGQKFDHGNKKTWIFYQKVNNIRHAAKLPNAPIKISPLTSVAVNTFLETHTEEELRALLVRP